MSGMQMFDTLAFARKLKNAGYPAVQAEAMADAQSDVFREMLSSSLATKSDFDVLTKDSSVLKQDVGILKQDVGILKQDVGILKQDVGIIKQDIDLLRNEITIAMQKVTIRLGSMIVAAVAILAAMKFFH